MITVLGWWLHGERNRLVLLLVGVRLLAEKSTHPDWHSYLDCVSPNCSQHPRSKKQIHPHHRHDQSIPYLD